MMRGRKPVPEFNHIMLEGNAREVQQQGSKIDFLESDITVLSQQPGLGKTHAVIEFCKNNPEMKILYITSRHHLIDEIIQKIPKASHWHGFSHIDNNGPRGCPKFLNPKVRNLYDAGLGTFYICYFMGCDQDKCAYRRQFWQNDIVFAPVDYINTSYVMGDNRAFKFDICFIDESILKTDKLKLDLEECKKAIQAVSEVASIDYIMPFLENREYKKLDELRSTIKSDINDALIKNGKSGNYTKIADINKLNIDKILEYGFYDQLYQGKIENSRMLNGIPIYHKPFSYKIFEIAQQAPVVMLDASFQETLFEDHLEFYNFEYGLKKDLRITIYRSNARNLKSIIYRMNSSSAHPRENFKKHKATTMQWVKSDLKQIYQIFGSENVGIITYKDLLAENIIMKRTEFLGFEAMSYGDLLGSNSFDGKKVLVVLGTYDIPREEVVDEIYKHYLLNYEINSITDAKTMKESHDSSSGDLNSGPWGLDGEDFTDGYRALWGTKEPNERLPYMISSARGANEIYQALHRSRFLTNDVIIFAYCHLPGKVLTEAQINRVGKRDTDGLFMLLKEKYDGKPRTDMAKVSSIVNDIDAGLSPTNICKKYKIRNEDKKHDRKSVRGMKEVLKSCQNNL
jgi:hypothetical protein